MRKLFGVLLLVGYFGANFGLCILFALLLKFPYSLLVNMLLGAFVGYNSRRVCKFISDQWF